MALSVRQDNVRCVILGRTNSREKWELYYISLTKSLGWRTVKEIKEDEVRRHPKCQWMLVLEEDYDQGRLRALRPPKDFDFGNPIEFSDAHVKNNDETLAEAENSGFNSNEVIQVEAVAPKRRKVRDELDF